MNKTVDFFYTFTFFPYKRHGLEWVVNLVVKSSSNLLSSLVVGKSLISGGATEGEGSLDLDQYNLHSL